MVKIKIQYGKKQEIQRIKETLSMLDWYKEHRVGVRLPKGVSEENVQEIVEGEFNEVDYRAAAVDLEGDFRRVPEDFFSGLERRAGKSLPESLDVVLTKYGCGGSYHCWENRIIINITAGRNGHKPIYCFKHELIHIALEDEVQERKLNQEQKEDLINSISKEIDFSQD